MSISAINAAASYEAPKQSSAKAEPVEMVMTRETPAQTQPVTASNGSETGYGSEEQQEKEKGRQGIDRSAHVPQNKHDPKHGSFHQHPGSLVRDRPSPRGGAEYAVAGLDELQGNKNDGSHATHQPQKELEVGFIHVCQSCSGGKDSASEGKAKENSAGFSFALPSAAYLM